LAHHVAGCLIAKLACECGDAIGAVQEGDPVTIDPEALETRERWLRRRVYDPELWLLVSEGISQ
jgi:hypothetical protein